MNATTTAPADELTISGSSGPLAILPAVCDLKRARSAHKALMQLAGESALADGKVGPDLIYAVGLALAFIGAADNQTEALTRITARMGAKPTAAQKARLSYWQGCATAGKSAWRKGAESIDIAALVGHANVAAMAPAALAESKRRAEQEKRELGEKKQQEARRAAVADAAAKNAAALIDAAVMAAYRDAMAHGAGMDNSAAPAYLEAAEKAAEKAAAREAVAAKEAAEKAAWREQQAATRAADVLVNRAVAASEFEQLAAALGIKLTPAQIKALNAEKDAMLAA